MKKQLQINVRGCLSGGGTALVWPSMFNSFGPAGTASTNGPMETVDVNTGKEIRRFHANAGRDSFFSFSANGEQAFGLRIDTEETPAEEPGKTKTIELPSVVFWDATTGAECRTLKKAGWPIVSSIDGNTVLTTDQEGTIDVWDLSRLTRYREFDKSVPLAQAKLQASPDDPRAIAVLGNWWAFRDRNDWAVELLNQARAAGGDVSSLTFARCYWQLGKLLEANREFISALARHEAADFYLQLCIQATQPFATTQNGRDAVH